MAKGVGGNKKLKFRTTENQNNARRRKFLAAFIIITIIIAAVSVTVIIKEYDPFGGPSDSDGEELTSGNNIQLAEYITVLFAGVPTSQDGVSFASYITLNTEKREFTVSAVSPGREVNGKSLSEIYAERGAEDLSEAVAESYDVTIDRYVVVTEKKFKPFIAALGYYEIDLKNPIDYQNGDFSLNLLSGKQKLNGETLFKYIKFTGLNGSDYELKAQAGVIADLLAQKLNPTNTDKGEDLFGTLINNCDSNITIIDFSKYRDLLSEISAEPRIVKVQSAAEE